MAKLLDRVREYRLRARDFMERHDLLFPSSERVGWKQLVSWSPWHIVSLVALWSAFGYYVYQWVISQSGFLFDPMLQTDDARTQLFFFHQYEPDRPFVDDPISEEMYGLTPPAFRLLYRLLVPFFGVLWSAKVVQGICLLLLGYGAYCMARARRVGLAAGLLAVFFVLHSENMLGRVAGGLPRGFAFPLIVIWLSGALDGNQRRRLVASFVAGTMYPASMMMILAAEGLLVFREARPLRETLLGGPMRRYALFVAISVGAVLPFMLEPKDVGPIHTLEQAEKEPAFGRSGRLWLLPFRNPVREFSENFFEPVNRKKSDSKEVRKMTKEWGAGLGLLVVSVFVVLVLTRAAPSPYLAIAFLTAQVIMYLLARGLAFRLWSPERYYFYGAPAACMLLAVCAVGLCGHRLSERFRPAVRNVAAALAIFGLFTLNGTPRKDHLMTINGRRHAALWEEVKSLPPSSRIAAHPMDADDIPLFGRRPNTGGFETLQPWFVDSWARQKARAEAVLDAMYATERSQLLAFCRENGVTHILVNRARYRSNFKRKARMFEPFGAYLRRSLAKVQLADLVLRDVPESSVIIKHGSLQLLDVKRLAQAWHE